MSALDFEVVGSRVEPYAAAPTVMLRLRLAAPEGAPVHAVALKCQVRIEPQRRQYSASEERRLYDLFGETTQWGDSLRPFLWTHVGTVVTGFQGETEVDLPLPCSFDMEVAGAKYLNSLEQGEMPLLLLFSGTVFSGSVLKGTGFQAEPVAWHAEARYRLPVAVWREAMDAYFPNSAWVRVERDTLDALSRWKASRALPTWDLAFERLLKEAGE